MAVAIAVDRYWRVVSLPECPALRFVAGDDASIIETAAMATELVDIFAAPDYLHEVQRAADSLRDGGVVVLPTETVYGAAAALTHRGGLGRLKELRGLSEGSSKPFTVHL